MKIFCDDAEVDNVAEEVPVPDGEDITGLLLDWGSGNRAALDKLTPLVYNELQALAARQLRAERPHSTTRSA